MIGLGALLTVKLSIDNLHIWKLEIELVLAYRNARTAVSHESSFEQASPKLTRWMQSDITTRAIIGLSMSDDML